MYANENEICIDDIAWIALDGDLLNDFCQVPFRRFGNLAYNFLPSSPFVIVPGAPY
jgi:hypothetical protein